MSHSIPSSPQSVANTSLIFCVLQAFMQASVVVNENGSAAQKWASMSTRRRDKRFESERAMPLDPFDVETGLGMVIIPVR